MRRRLAIPCTFLCTLTAAFVALAGSDAVAAPLRQATGMVTYASPLSLTIQTSGRRMGVVNAMAATATALTKDDYSYVWGGGHAEAGVASIGIRGTGYTGHTHGFDCSGSVAAVLAGAGLWPAGAPVPGDAGVIAQLLGEHLIARGAGTGPVEVTLFDDPGVHIFMNIDGRFFGTSDGGGGGSAKGGPGWLDDGAPDAASRAYRQYHVLPSVLHDRTSYGHSFTFQIGALSTLGQAVQIGDSVQVSYADSRAGEMALQTLSWVGSQTASATVTAVASGTFTAQTAAGQTLTFSTGADPDLTANLADGDAVTVTYTTAASGLVARVVTVASPSVTPVLGGSPAGNSGAAAGGPGNG